MPTQPTSHLTPEEYLAIERAAETRSEYFGGEMFAMSGASWVHNRITANLNGLLYNALRGGNCKSVSDQMRLHVPATGLYTYPDVVVVCGEAQFLDNTFDTLLNPTLIAELLSPSTEAYDRGRKFDHYQSIPTVSQYVLIAQDRVSVEVFTRQGDGTWMLKPSSALSDSVDLHSIKCSLAVADLYESIDFSRARP